MKKILRLIERLIYIVKWWFLKQKWRFVSLQYSNAKTVTNTNYSIGITTYKERFETYLKPLVLHLNYLFPHMQIIVAINGFHNQKEQTEYLNKIKSFLSNFKNIDFVYYEQPHGLCKLWNQLIILSKSDKIVVLNDDISISKKLKTEIEESKILNSNFGLINGSYSHFLINKKIINQIGWFDERFPGIGYEDHDYEIRLALQGVSPDFYNFKTIKNENVTPKDWSWGDDDTKIFKKYSHANEKHYFSKWEISDTAKHGFVHVRIIKGYAKLKDGMETPNFYPDLNEVKA
ncbi:MAG: hypothetical protein COW67_08705 [Flavobacteriales bacterium CG18_big_fil_WC_8_21_14_2_50_32_9]|nr:glycosyltransferase family 2 protein [Flavobacteriales bacterium]PIQ15383.1 MAG: hypothetical protein COW67_08705 [Flavobacteriales bacterium CG18_big_fil_WC_8_21_14_2_50_32_9]PJC62562.1 MAG: hypothetical protein CO022_03925 [Flavobacteriales bacterium CG_4_9_14_0_2_um_filter_32_27]